MLYTRTNMMIGIWRIQDPKNFIVRQIMTQLKT